MTFADPALPPHGKPARWHRRKKSADAVANRAMPLALAPPKDIDAASPLDMVAWLAKRYCAVIDAEDRKGAAADPKRIDQTLKAAAMLARGAAPYRHARLKPADPPQPNVRNILEVRWMKPDARDEPSTGG